MDLVAMLLQPFCLFGLAVRILDIVSKLANWFLLTVVCNV